MIDGVYKRVGKYISKSFKKIQMLNNRRKLKFEIIVKDRIPRLKIQENHEKQVRWTIRILTAIGIFLSVVTYSQWYYPLSVSIGLFLLSKVLEKMIFTYTVMIVQPMPIKWDGAAWSMMAIGKFNNRYVLAFGFNDKEVAMDFFDTILYWNYSELINDKNINVSLVLEDKNNYSVHVYPGIERAFVINAMNESKEHFKYDKYGKDQTHLVMQMDICKVFPNSPKSAFNLLRDAHDEIYICIYDTRKFSESNPNTINNVRPFDDRKILCKNIKVMKRRDLDKQKEAIEYFHVPSY